MKEFWKSVNIWRRYGKCQSGTFLGHSVCKWNAVVTRLSFWVLLRPTKHKREFYPGFKTFFLFQKLLALFCEMLLRILSTDKHKSQNNNGIGNLIFIEYVTKHIDNTTTVLIFIFSSARLLLYLDACVYFSRKFKRLLCCLSYYCYLLSLTLVLPKVHYSLA